MTTATAAKTATYTKLNNGDWGIRVSGDITTGAIVTVTKRDGSTKTEIVGKVVWTGKDKYSNADVSICTVQQVQRVSCRPSYRGGRSGRMSCPECGDWVDVGTSCWETGMIHR